MLDLALSFQVQGEIRDKFTQKIWEKAYDSNDNIFRMKIIVDLKLGKKTKQYKFLHKAILFWTRNPKIPHRIWISIVKDEIPFYPLSEDEARSTLFDIRKIIEISGQDIDKEAKEISAEISVSWGKHYYCEPEEISAKTYPVAIDRI